MSTRKAGPCTATLAAVLMAAAALANNGAVIDFTTLETYVAQQDAATVGGDKFVHRVWAKLDHRLGKISRNFGVDLAKLNKLTIAAEGPLVNDAELQTLVGSATDAADQRLGQEPDEVASLIGQIRLQKNRDRVLRIVQAARDLHDLGAQQGGTGDALARIKSWRAAERKFVQAATLARHIIRSQGGPLPQAKVAQPNRVYTVVGQGEGGFNGDGREARRTRLYFVEECRIGPDGLLYILDWNNHMMRRRTADGRIERLCGSGTPGDSEGAPMTTDLNHPSSLVFDGTPGGKVFLAAWHNHKVKVYDPVGGPGGTPTVYTIAGTTQGNAGEGQLATVAKYNLLPGIVRLPSGDLVTCDAGNEVLRKIALNPGTEAPNLVGTMVHTGTITRFAGTTGTPGTTGDGGDALSCTLNFSRAQNAEPDGRMELSPDGTKLYVISGAGHCIRYVDLTAEPPTIHRFAGTGTAGYTGDGGNAIDATLNRPSDIAVAGDGTVYISDSFNNVIRKVTTDGKISTYAGASDGSSGSAGDDIALAEAKFKHPAGLELDAKGNLYVCDRENSVIRVITSADPGTEISLPVAPYVIPEKTRGGPPAKGPAGTIATYAGHDPEFEGLAQALQEGAAYHLGFNGDGRGALDTDLYWPQDLAVDPNPVTSFVHIVDWNNHRIRRIENDGTIRTVVGSGLLGDAGGEGPNAKLNHPTDITFHPVTGDLWIAAWHTDKIIRLDSTTNRIKYMVGNKRAFSGDNGVVCSPYPEGSDTVGIAEMNIPASVKFTANGDWYVSDQGNQRLRRVDAASGVITTICGDGFKGDLGDDGPAASAEISLPVGQAAQPAGRICISPDEHWLYLADTDNNRVRRIDLTDPERRITAFAGTGVAGYAGDGAAATAAKLNYPTDVDCDAAGNVYVADRDNSVIRKVDVATGTITTFAGNGETGFGGNGGAASSARLNRPSGLLVVRSGPTAGRVYVADTYNGVVRVIWE
jgi:sugar lactone lactonase YvrE